MKRLIAVTAALVTVALPATAVSKPDQPDRKNAAQECRFERGSTAATREAFRVRYGTNKNGRNAFGKCVSRRSTSEERQRKAAKSNASKECNAEREELGTAAFAAKYGTNKNGRNAFGKCVSGKAKAKKDAADEGDAQRSEERRSAARECAAERETLGREAFGAKYGTNRNKRNAFGKCVSKEAQSS